MPEERRERRKKVNKFLEETFGFLAGFEWRQISWEELGGFHLMNSMRLKKDSFFLFLRKKKEEAQNSDRDLVDQNP